MLGLEGAIAQELANQGFGTFDPLAPTADIRVGEEPNTPDNVITVFNVSGGRIPSEISEVWLLTVRVRNLSYEVASETLRNVARHLQEKGQGVFGDTTRIARLRASAPPAPLGRDQVRRFTVEQTFEALMKRSFQFDTTP